MALLLLSQIKCIKSGIITMVEGSREIESLHLGVLFGRLLSNCFHLLIVNILICLSIVMRLYESAFEEHCVSSLHVFLRYQLFLFQW